MTRKGAKVAEDLSPEESSSRPSPSEFATAAVRTIKEKLADRLVEGIRYERINEWYEMTQLEAEIEGCSLSI